MEEIWKKGLIGASLRKSHDQNQFAEDTAQASLLLSENRSNLQTATFAAGCFWGVEEEFRKVKGVKSTIVGYTGGWFEYPSYKHVCTDRTGHAEAIQIMYDPSEVSYADLLVLVGPQPNNQE